MTEKKTKKQLKEEVESQYVAETLDITYTMPAGLANLLANASNLPVNEVWCTLSELANVCAVRLSTRNDSYGTSWSKKKFPGTNIELRIDMNKRSNRRYNYQNRQWEGPHTSQYFAKFKISGMKTQSFTQQQVNDYILRYI